MTLPVFSWAALRVCCLAGVCLFATQASGQIPRPDPDPPSRTEASEAPALDDFTTRQVVSERPVLPYQPVRESDILWEKRIWRVIDVREKQNLAFTYPEAPLVQLLVDAAMAGQLTAYADDHFSEPLTLSEVGDEVAHADTVYVYNMDTGLDELKVVQNSFDPAAVHRFRVKEAWFFDTRTSQLSVRILGIAPMLDETDSNGDFKYEKPMFWIHYPSARPYLARQKAYWPGDNMAATLSWEDLFEMRRFSSMVYKENNPYDRRLQDYLSGEDMVYEAQKIQNDLFNRESDLWSW